MGNSKYYIWSTIGTYGTQAIGFVGNILIARILMPFDFGLIAMLAIIMGLAWNFTESGFADCLIRKADADKLDFGTVATFNIAVGAIMYLLIFITSPYFAAFFKQPDLVGIARVLGLSILIKALTVTPITGLRKNLQFKSLTMMNLFASVVSVTLIYFMAARGYGYWALAFQSVFIALANLFFLLVIVKWHPYFCFNVSRFKEMFGFSANLLGAYITNQFGQNLYSLIIGKYYPVDSLGYYRQAQKMYETPTQGLNNVVLTTSYSLIAREKDREKQVSMYYSIFKKFLTLQSLMVLSFIGLAKPAFYLLLGEKWITSIPYFQLFMLMSLVFPLVTINSNIAKIHNKPRIYRNLTFLRNGLRVLALIICARFSLLAILYGQIAAAYVSVIIDMYFCGRVIDFGLLKQLKQFIGILFKPLIPFILASFLIYVLKYDIYLSGIIWLLSFFTILIIIYIVTRDSVFKDFIIRLNSFKKH